MSGEEKKFYVYVLLDPRKPGEYRYEGLDFTFAFAPFYVGKGTAYRWRAHYTKSINTTNVLKNNVIAKLNREGLKRTHVKVLETFDEVEAYAVEKHVINTIGRKIDNTGILTNISEARCGKETGYKHTPEAIANMTGLTRSEEAKANMRVAQKGKVVSAETRLKQSLVKTGVKLPHTAEWNKNIGDGRRGKLMTSEQKQYTSFKHINTRYEIENTSGGITVVYNIRQFCSNNNLDRASLHKTIPGLHAFRAQHKGFKIKNRLLLPSNWRELPEFIEEYMALEALNAA